MVDSEKTAPDHHEHHEDDHASISKAPADSSAAMESALDASGGAPNPWGRGHIQLYLCCMIIYLCSTMNGNLEPGQTSLVNTFANRKEL